MAQRLFDPDILKIDVKIKDYPEYIVSVWEVEKVEMSNEPVSFVFLYIFLEDLQSRLYK